MKLLFITRYGQSLTAIAQASLSTFGLTLSMASHGIQPVPGHKKAPSVQQTDGATK